jgi:hypothetical protein
MVSIIACVNINHQNQLEQMAIGAMFATSQPPIDYIGFHVFSDCMFEYRRPMGKCLFHILSA